MSSRSPSSATSRNCPISGRRCPRPICSATLTAERLQLRPQSFYDKHQIDLITGDRAARSTARRRRVTLASGTTLAYDHLVLATGARNRKLPVDGAELDGVLYLRTLAEADAIKERFAAANNIVVAGAGFIGLELAAVASKLGKAVTVIEPLARCMSRAVSGIASRVLCAMRMRNGACSFCSTRGCNAFMAQGGRVTGVTLSDGRDLPADLVLVGIGIEPMTDLAQAAGLPSPMASSSMRASRPPIAKISAIGDCASFPDPAERQAIRLESVQNAVDQGRCVAKRIVGQPADYAAVPWFWSDQRDLKLQMVGLTAGCDRTVVRGDPAERAFSVFCFHGRPAARHRVRSTAPPITCSAAGCWPPASR